MFMFVGRYVHQVQYLLRPEEGTDSPELEFR